VRFERIDLARYGHFSDRSVELRKTAEGGRDFHLVVGANEAGKSTTRDALADLLFGFGHKTRYDFQHKAGALRVGAVVAANGRSLEVRRRKGRSETLLDAADGVLPEKALRDFLGDCDRDLFERVFGLDRERLLAGGRDILEAKGEVGQLLFQSAEGLAHLWSVRARLSSEADMLWSPHRAQRRAYYKALTHFEETQRKLRQVEVRSKDWNERRRTVETLAGQLAEAKDALQRCVERRTTLTRARRVAPHLQLVRTKRQELAGLGEVPSLPEHAADTLEGARGRIAAAQAREQLAAKRLEESKTGLAEVVVDEAVLRHAEEIGGVAKLGERYAAHGGKLAERRTEREALRLEAGRQAQDLGWSAATPEELAAALPSKLVRGRLAELRAEHGTLSAQREAKQNAREAAAATLAEHEQQLGELVVAEIPGTLSDAVAAARDLGDVGATRRDLASAAERARLTAERTKAGLGSVCVEPDALRAMILPAGETVQALIKARSKLEAEVRAGREALQERSERVERMQLEVEQLERAGVGVTREEVLSARQERNERWEALKKSPARMETDAGAFEEALGHADELADRREDNLDASLKLARARDDLEGLQLEREQLGKRLAGYEEQMLSVEQRWRELSQRAGLGALLLDDFVSWCAKREAAIEAADRVQEAERNLAVWDARVVEARDAVRAALTGAGVVGSEADKLPDLVRQAEELVSQRTKAEADQRALERNRAGAVRTLATCTEDVERLDASQAEWQRAMKEALLRAGLSEDLSVGEIGAALTLMDGIEQRLEKIAELERTQIGPMERELAELAERTRALGHALGDEPRAEPDERALERHRARLAAAEKALAARKTLENQHQKATAEVEQELKAQVLARATLEPLLEAAKVDTLEALAEAVERSRGRLRLKAELRDAETTLVEQGDGLSPARLAEDVDAVNLESLAGDLAALEVEEKGYVEAMGARSAEHAKAEKELEAIGGSDEAAKTEAERQEAIAAMAEAIEAYLPLRTSTLLLDAAIERYRKTHQGPMLELAGKAFAKLTLGSFAGLEVDSHDGKHALLGVRPDGERVEVTGMSEGSRDQLYLALYLAALQMRVERGAAMPFVADDLVVNFDDRRAHAALSELGELSKRTQVLFLTHHEHLIPLVQDAIGQDVNIVRL
jgi:uncharacterized protein YhaN